VSNQFPIPAFAPLTSLSDFLSSASIAADSVNASSVSTGPLSAARKTNKNAGGTSTGGAKS
jgi:hypothetical protein